MGSEPTVATIRSRQWALNPQIRVYQLPPAWQVPQCRFSKEFSGDGNTPYWWGVEGGGGSGDQFPLN